MGYYIHYPDERGTVAISYEEYNRQRDRVKHVDNGTSVRTSICPECGGECTMGIVTPGYKCTKCWFHITGQEMAPHMLYLGIPLKVGGAINVLPVAPMSFLDELKYLLGRNPTHRLTPVIWAAIRLYEHIHEKSHANT